MGLNLKLKGIVSPNPFKLLYKTGATAGNESVVTTGYTYYPNSGTTYQASSDGSYYNTNPIIFSGASYSTQYWFKILDTVTGGYVIENIFTNHEEVYDDCINCCLFTGGTSNYIDCRFSGGSAISDQIITPSPTPTTTPADCTFTGGSSEYNVIITPTPTTTTTIIEPTITPTTTSTIQTSSWGVRNADCGFGTLNDIGINSSFMNSLNGPSNFPLTSTLYGTKSNPNGVNYGGTNTIQANVTTNLPGTGNCAALRVTINGTTIYETYFSTNPFPQVSGVIINSGDTVEVEVACYPGPCS